MFNAHPRTLQQIEPHLRRVLVIDPHPEWARLIADLLKGLGAAQLDYGRPDRLAAQMNDVQPMLIVTELAGPGYDGLQFTRALRRAEDGLRQAPVIMVTADATRGSILAARNAGVHEFLRKPFTAGDLFRRIENVTLKPRAWVEAAAYVGPDRRRFNSGEFAGPRKRRADRPDIPAAANAV